jgi:thiamine pyrophosphokinase
VLVGDLDSVDADEVDAAREAGVRIDRHDPAKDETDLELAVELALAAGAVRIVVLGGAGGRLDHLAANLAVLAGPSTAAARVEAFVGPARIDVIRGERVIDGRAGMKVSLLAWGGPATGVSTGGLRWPLTDAVLATGSALGTSNEFLSDSATVAVGTGVVTAIAPDVSSLHPLAEVST